MAGTAGRIKGNAPRRATPEDGSRERARSALRVQRGAGSAEDADGGGPVGPVGGREAQSFLEVLDGAGQVAGPLLGLGAEEVARIEAGLDSDRLVEGGDRVRELLLLPEDHAAIVLRLEPSGVERHDAIEIFEGGRVVPQ